MNSIVRNEEYKDYKRCEEVARNAFWNLYRPGAYEHHVVHTMRDHDDFIKELAFVIEVDGQVEGAIYYTHAKIVTKDGKEYPVVSFGPVFISPKFHRNGLGRKMITHSIDKAREMGYQAILTLGYPYHYNPYGFLGGKNYNIAMEDGKYYKGLLVLPLYQNALHQVAGRAIFSEVFESNEDEVEAFDKQFSYKKKEIKKSQLEFEVICATLDE